MSLITDIVIDGITTNSNIMNFHGDPELGADQRAVFVSDGSVPGTIPGNLYFGESGSYTDISTGGSGPGPSLPDYEAISILSGGDPDPNVEISDIALNNGTNVVRTLADPSPATLGLKKKLMISQYVVGSSLTLNIPSFVHGNGLIFNALGSSASLIWSNSGWIIDVSGADVF